MFSRIKAWHPFILLTRVLQWWTRQQVVSRMHNPFTRNTKSSQKAFMWQLIDWRVFPLFYVWTRNIICVARARWFSLKCSHCCQCASPYFALMWKVFTHFNKFFPSGWLTGRFFLSFLQMPKHWCSQKHNEACDLRTGWLELFLQGFSLLHNFSHLHNPNLLRFVFTRQMPPLNMVKNVFYKYFHSLWIISLLQVRLGRGHTTFLTHFSVATYSYLHYSHKLGMLWQTLDVVFTVFVSLHSFSGRETFVLGV